MDSQRNRTIATALCRDYSDELIEELTLDGSLITDADRTKLEDAFPDIVLTVR